MTAQPGFIFGGDTGVQTPEELARLRAIADALRGPVAPKTVGQGLSAIGEALGYRLANSRANKAEVDWRKGGDSVFSALFGSTGAGSTPAGAGGAPTVDGGNVASPGLGGAAGPAPDLSGNDIYSGFMDTVKSKVTNPNGLAAVASTANAESRFQPKNAFGSWSDPSESGAAGTAGGILSWRGPRFEAMRNFAAKNGGDASNPSPQLQAQFFLQEDPTLIDRLNAAKSPTEAQQIMNNAWKFAGYDRPGGEAGRRIAQANSFVSRFAGSPADPVQVASLDPSAGVPAAPGGAVAAALAGAPPATAQPQNPAQALAGGPPAPMPVQSPRAADGGGAPMLGAKPAQGAIRTGPDGKTYQYVETTGMAGATSDHGWIPVNTGAAPSAAGGGVQVADGGPTVPQLMKAATDPRLSPEQRGVVGMLLKQKMAAADPATQLEMEKNRLDMEKTRIETERLRNPQMTPAEKARLDFEERKMQADQDKLIEVGGSLVDPKTHQAVYSGQQTDWEKLDDGTLYNKRTGETKAVTASPGGGQGNMFKGNAVDAQALNWLVNNNKVTQEQAAQIAAGKTITGPNGEMMFLTPSGIVAQMPGQAPQPITPPPAAATPAAPAPTPAPAAPPPIQAPAIAPAPTSPRAANPAPTQNAGIVPLTGPKSKAPNEQQQRDAKLYSVVGPELKIVEDNFSALSNLSDQALSAVPHGSDFGADYLKSSDYQRASNSLKTIIASYLYSVSGATAAPAEVENQAAVLTPKPGEAKASVDDKLARVRAMVDAIKNSRGGDAPADSGTGGAGTTANGLKWSIEP
jgi:hypothetical protein